MSKQELSDSIILEPCDNRRLADLCGQMDEHLRQIENFLGVEINNRENAFQVIGSPQGIEEALTVIKQLYDETEAKNNINPQKVDLLLQSVSGRTEDEIAEQDLSILNIKTPRITIKPRNANQQHYVKYIQKFDINFGVGPAGTGKTYLAVAAAAAALKQDQIKRILLVRPAVEAGERLGFLPGDLTQKIDPYLRPLYDALYEMLGVTEVHRLIEKNIIEIAPLAYMRGRTLNDSFIILDESQNTTQQQMKMFLTRIGFGSKTVITGDITQVDLPRHETSGLRHAIEVLKDIEGLSFTFFQARDVVRHPLVQRVVQAYDTYETQS